MFIANSLSAELVKKGAALEKGSDKVIYVKVVDVNMTYSGNYQVDGMLEFRLSDGTVGSNRFGGSGVKAYRALGGALQWGVANIVNQQEVRSFLEKKDPSAGKDLAETPDAPKRLAIDNKFKLAVIPFKAGSFDKNDAYQMSAIEVLAQAANETDKIALTHSCYAFKESLLEQYHIIQMDLSNQAIKEDSVWKRGWGKYELNTDKLGKFASSENLDLLFTCRVACTRGRTYCPEIIIETYLYSVTDNKVFREKTQMRHSEQADHLVYIHNYYTNDAFYANLRKMSAALFEEYIETQPVQSKPKGLTVQ